MQKHFLKFGKVFINVACSPLILISNNSELAAKYLPNDVDQSIKTLEIPNFDNDFFTNLQLIVVNFFKPIFTIYLNYEKMNK